MDSTHLQGHIYVAHYIGKGNLFDKAIRFWQWLSVIDRVLHFFNYREASYKYYETSHTEIVFELNGKYTFISSSPRDGGVRIKEINPNSGHWEFTKIPITEQQNYLLIIFFNRQIGKPYDKLGILFSQLFPFGISNHAQFFCSEFTVTALEFAGIITCYKHLDWYNPARTRCILNGYPEVNKL